MSNQMQEMANHVNSKENQSVKPIGDFTKYILGFVEVERGLSDTGDYVVHFSSYHKAKPFPKDNELFLRIIATYLKPFIPSDIDVDIYLPPDAWEKKVISLIARGFGKQWNFDESRLNHPIEQVCNHMTDEINRQNPRRTNL